MAAACVIPSQPKLHHSAVSSQTTQPSKTAHTAKPTVVRRKHDSDSSAMKASKLATVSVKRDIATSATQPFFRGGFDLRGFQSLCYVRPNLKAIKIQSFYRGYRCRRELQYSLDLKVLACLSACLSNIEAFKRRVSWSDDNTWDGLETETFYALEEPGRLEAFRDMRRQVRCNYILQRNAEYAFRVMTKIYYWLRRRHPQRFILGSEYQQRYQECYFFRQKKDIINLELKLRFEFAANL